MMKNQKSQFAIEFVVLIAFMFVIFLGFTAIITSKILSSKEAGRQQTAEDLAALAKNEIDLASSVTDGYNRTFSLPTLVEGNSYEIMILDNRELVVKYLDKEHLSFLQDNVIGNINPGKNTITKNDGIVYINS